MKIHCCQIWKVVFKIKFFYAEKKCCVFHCLVESFSHSQSLQKVARHDLKYAHLKAFRSYRGLHLSLAGCTSICYKIIVWQVICNKCILFTFGWVNREVKHDVYGKRQKWNFWGLSSAVRIVEWKYLYLRWIEENIFLFFCVIYLRIRTGEYNISGNLCHSPPAVTTMLKFSKV